MVEILTQYKLFWRGSYNNSPLIVFCYNYLDASTIAYQIDLCW